VEDVKEIDRRLTEIELLLGFLLIKCLSIRT
jgi:hypothetical protein